MLFFKKKIFQVKDVEGFWQTGSGLAQEGWHGLAHLSNTISPGHFLSAPWPQPVPHSLNVLLSNFLHFLTCLFLCSSVSLEACRLGVGDDNGSNAFSGGCASKCIQHARVRMCKIYHAVFRSSSRRLPLLWSISFREIRAPSPKSTQKRECFFVSSFSSKQVA